MSLAMTDYSYSEKLVLGTNLFNYAKDVLKY